MGTGKKDDGRTPGTHPSTEGAALPYAAEWDAFNLKIFRLVLDATALVFLAIFARGMLTNGCSVAADAVTLAVIVALRLLVSMRPRWRRGLGWAALASLMVNALVKVDMTGGDLPCSYSLHPIIVLFAVLTGDAALSAAAFVFVMGLYALPLFFAEPLPHYEIVELGDLVILTLGAGACSYAAWLYHRMLSRELLEQWRNSRRNADLNRKLTSALFHDIANPLFVIRATSDLALVENKTELSDMERIGRMCAHIESIRESVRGLESGGRAEVDSTSVSVAEIASHLGELFAPHIQMRAQELVVAQGDDLIVRTDRAVLCNSVLGNYLSNALHHAPSHSRITLSARAEGCDVLIELRDHGEGFPSEVLRAVEAGDPSIRRSDGTRRGYGLWIAACHLARLGGTFSLSNHPEGGAMVTVRLPAGR